MSFPIRTEMRNATSAKKAADGGEKNALLKDFNKPNKSRFFSQGKNSGLPELLSSPSYLRGPWAGPCSLAEEAVFPWDWRSAPWAGRRKSWKKEESQEKDCEPFRPML
jgi:hypothetical protein